MKCLSWEVLSLFFEKEEVVGTTNVNSTTKEELARMMVGRDVIFDIEKEEVEKGDVILQVNNIEVLNNKGLKAVKNLSFDVRSGEILGIAGVSGNGQKELVEAITGLRKVEKEKLS